MRVGFDIVATPDRLLRQSKASNSDASYHLTVLQFHAGTDFVDQREGVLIQLRSSREFAAFVGCLRFG